MKKVWTMALCLMLSVCLVLSLTACFGGDDSSDPVSTPDNSVVDTPAGGDNSGTDTTPDGGDNNNVAGDGGNSVDGGLLFGDPDTTTTTTTGKQDGTTTQNAGGQNGTTTQNAGGQNGTTTTTGQEDPAPATTTTTKKPTTTTTVAPPQQEEINNVNLPAAGYDPDGKGRIVVEKSEVKTVDKKQVAYITFVNQSNKTGKKWIIPEYSKVTYACYDKKGNAVQSSETNFGTMFLGSLEVGEKVTCQFEIPKGTVEVKITGHNLEYWTPWS